MIQMAYWIFLICLISMASSIASLDKDSELIRDESETFSSMTTASRIPEILLSAENGSSENISIDSSSSLVKIPENTDMPETLPINVEKISTVSSVSASSISEMPEPVYRGNKTVAYESTIENFKKSTTNTNPTETSVVTFNENLYHVGRTSDKEMNPTVSPHSGMVVLDETIKSITTENPMTEKLNELPSDQMTTEAYFSINTLSSEGNFFTKSYENNSDIKEIVADEKSTETPKSVESREVPTTLRSESIETGFIRIKEIKDTNENETAKSETLHPKGEDEENQTLSSSADADFSELPTSKDVGTSLIFTESKKQNEKLQENINISSELPEDIETHGENISPSTDRSITQLNEDIEDSMTVDSTDTNSNSTRNPKKIQENEERERYPEGRVRPLHPDPGYANYGEKDTARPYRPDSPLHHYPYHRPTPDYRTPIAIREDKDYTRPSRPESEFHRPSFRPNYSYSRTPQDDRNPSPKPNRPSFGRPSYVPPSGFGRPYRPNYPRPTSKPEHEFSDSKLSEIKGGTQDFDVAEHSRADYEYTKLYESSVAYTKNYNSDIRPSAIMPNFDKPYQSNYDSTLLKSTSPENTVTERRDNIKISTPVISTNSPSSFYPRPVFGNKYQTTETYPRPAFGNKYQTSETFPRPVFGNKYQTTETYPRPVFGNKYQTTETYPKPNKYQTTESDLKPSSVGIVTSAKNLTRVEYIKADCFDNHMKVTMKFNGTFDGLVYSSGYASDSSCSYVNGSGRNHYEFYIRLNRCGTLGQQEVSESRMRSDSRRRQERAQYLVNTITVQYNPVIEEEIDEHIRVTCEYGYDFWKTVSFPILNVESSAVKVRTGNPVVFTLPPPQCNMEIRAGYGPNSPRVSGPVNVGDPLTLVIHMKSESTGFDILISNCVAHNGAQKRLQLIDSNGCVGEDNLVSPFRGLSSPDRSQQVTLYSYLKAFRFTGSPALYIECDVHMCHGSCPPQRCYWRHLYKRSVNEDDAESTTTPGNFVSESISLFQALEVRHDEEDTPNLFPLRNSSGDDEGDVVCLRTVGFVAIIICLVLLFLMATIAAICMSFRLKKMKKLVESPDIRQFVEFDRHVPRR